MTFTTDLLYIQTNGWPQVLEAALASKPKKKITKQDLWEVDSEAGWVLG